MTNVVRQKNLTCVEWTVQTPSRYGSWINSDSFKFHDFKCNLGFCSFSSTESSLFIEAEEKLNPAVEVIVLACISGKPSSHLQRHPIACKKELIWSCADSQLLDTLLTFVVIFYIDTSKEQLEAIVGGQKLMDSKENIHFEALSRDFSKLLEESSSCDVEITCGGKIFSAHQIVLRTRSTVFSAMLKSNMVEGNTGLIKVEDVKACIFQSFLSYLYSGILPELTIDTAKELYGVGDKYAVEELEKVCSEFLVKNLSIGNACEILILADQHSDENFRNNVISYIVDKKIPKHDKNWSNFCKSHPILAVEVQNLYIQKY